jgi:hypothetical protein
MSMSTRTRTTVIPAPRRPADDEIRGPARPELPAARYPWPEPWRSYRGARPRTEFWDDATATWLSRGPAGA